LGIRAIQDKDREHIRKALYDAVAKAGNRKQWFRTINLEVALQAIFSGKYYVFIVEETYLIMADCGSAWYADEGDKALVEMLVLKVYPQGPGKFNDVTRAFTALARVVGARAICVGTALAVNNRALARMYIREGFEASAVELYKEL